MNKIKMIVGHELETEKKISGESLTSRQGQEGDLCRPAGVPHLVTFYEVTFPSKISFSMTATPVGWCV
jgi:hypothetical protein